MQFGFWVIGGLLFFAALYVGLQKISNHVGEEGAHHATREQGRPKDTAQIINYGSVIIPAHDQKENASTEGQSAAQENAPSQIKFELSDALIAYFTYCLVIVGWFQIRRGEKSVRDMERAFVLGGVVVTVADANSPIGAKSNIPILPTGSSVMMGVQNYGRTPALVKNVFVQFANAEPSGDVAIYGAGESYSTDIGLQPNSDSVGIRSEPFQSPFRGTHFCFGYVEYEDFFRARHTSRFCMEITPTKIAFRSAGSPAYNEWD